MCKQRERKWADRVEVMRTDGWPASASHAAGWHAQASRAVILTAHPEQETDCLHAHTHTHHLQRGQRANVESVHARIQPEKGVRTHPTPAQTDTLSRLMRHLRESEVGEGWPEISDSSSWSSQCDLSKDRGGNGDEGKAVQSHRGHRGLYTDQCHCHSSWPHSQYALLVWPYLGVGVHFHGQPWNWSMYTKYKPPPQKNKQKKTKTGTGTKDIKRTGLMGQKPKSGKHELTICLPATVNTLHSEWTRAEIHPESGGYATCVLNKLTFFFCYVLWEKLMSDVY